MKPEEKSPRPLFIDASYTTTISYDIGEIEDELGISWSDVADFWVKWGCLHLKMKNGAIHEVSRNPADYEFHTDWKRPDDVVVYGDDYAEISREDALRSVNDEH